MLNDVSATGIRERLASNLRRLRIARRLSLSELARATGLSKATLSGIENERANPTVETLAGLAAALRVPLVELLQEAPLSDVRVVRAARRATERRGGLQQHPLEAMALEGELELAEIALQARERIEVDGLARGSRVHLYVLQGKLIAGPLERSSELGPGDYASFPGELPHVCEAQRQAARALLLRYVPG